MVRIFHSQMIANFDKVVKVTKECVTLHNFLMKTNNANSNRYCPANYVLGEGRKIYNAGLNNYSRDAKQMRDDFTNYFVSTEGSLDWQLERVILVI